MRVKFKCAQSQLLSVPSILEYLWIVYCTCSQRVAYSRSLVAQFEEAFPVVWVGVSCEKNGPDLVTRMKSNPISAGGRDSFTPSWEFMVGGRNEFALFQTLLSVNSRARCVGHITSLSNHWGNGCESIIDWPSSTQLNDRLATTCVVVGVSDWAHREKNGVKRSSRRSFSLKRTTCEPSVYSARKTFRATRSREQGVAG